MQWLCWNMFFWMRRKMFRLFGLFGLWQRLCTRMQRGM